MFLWRVGTLPGHVLLHTKHPIILLIQEVPDGTTAYIEKGSIHASSLSRLFPHWNDFTPHLGLASSAAHRQSSVSGSQKQMEDNSYIGFFLVYNAYLVNSACPSLRFVFYVTHCVSSTVNPE